VSGVDVERRGRVLYITLNRPARRNALDWDAWVAFSDAWNRLIVDDEVWVGVVRGAGEQAFSAGADLKAIPAQIAERRAQGDPNPIPPMAFNTETCPKPVVAAINGDALGGGLELALACDLRIAVEHARFGLPEAKWGGLPGAGGTQRLPRAVPAAIALEVMFTGRFLSAAEALEVHLVNRVVAADQLDGAVDTLVEQLLTMSPVALRAIKRAVLRGLDGALGDGLRFEQEVLDELMSTQDYRNGVGSFADGRTPQWVGR
jgi:dehydration protein DpgD